MGADKNLDNYCYNEKCNINKDFGVTLRFLSPNWDSIQCIVSNCLVESNVLWKIVRALNLKAEILASSLYNHFFIILQ